jgi:truncated hemoglobin YjbI
MRVDGRLDYQYIFDESYTRVMERDAFFDVFYSSFIESSPRVAEKFRDTDVNKQKLMLEKSLAYMTTFHTDLAADEEMESVARIHDRHHQDIEPKLYDEWLECLIDTVRKCDPRFDREVELAWRLTLAPGIAYMRFQHDAAL